MKVNKLFSVLAVVLVSGCSTIHFDKGEQIQAKKTTQLWHHNFALALYEGSSVVDPAKECTNAEWSSVKTELTFINGLSGGVANAVVGPLWYPKTVEISCK
ncbi:MAG: hypothetical protein JKX67_00760 [Colwellia sp.]|nr:hypothetical protein [Colwellia sp.]